MELNQNTSKEPLVRHFNKVCEILDTHEKNPRKLIPILQAVQEEYRYLPQDVMEFIATSLDIPASTVYGVATFYGHFALEPKGKHVCKVCDGTACHVKGSEKIISGIKDHLGLSKNEATTNDMMFTVETVSCVGACGLAPVVVVDEQVFGQATPDKMISKFKEISKEEAENGSEE